MKADSAPGRPAWTDAQISEALDVDPKTVAHLRQTVVEDGWAVALHGRSTRNRRRRGVDGKCEARLIAALCGPAPDGYARWSLRLLAAQAVELRALIALLPKSARPDLTPAEQHLFTRYATVTRPRRLRAHSLERSTSSRQGRQACPPPDSRLAAQAGVEARVVSGRQTRWRSGTLLPWTHLPHGYRVELDRPRDPAGVTVDPVAGAMVREFAACLEAGATLGSLSLAKRGSEIQAAASKSHAASYQRLIGREAHLRAEVQVAVRRVPGTSPMPEPPGRAKRVRLHSTPAAALLEGGPARIQESCLMSQTRPTTVVLILALSLIGCSPSPSPSPSSGKAPWVLSLTPEAPAVATPVPSPTSAVPNPTEPPGGRAAQEVVVDLYVDGEAPFLPHLPQAGQSTRLVLAAVYAELIRLDAAGQYVPYLAREVPALANGLARFTGSGADEQLEVEFRLRPDARWQDGRPLTAHDLVFSWALVMDPAWPGSHRGLVDLAAEAYVDSVAAPTPDRVVYRFMSQRQAREAARGGGRLGDPALYAALTQQVGPVVPLDFAEVGRNVFPRHLLGGVPIADLATGEFARRPVYAGAYRLVDGGERDQPVALQAFEGFVLGAPQVKSLTLGWPHPFDGVQTTQWLAPDRLTKALSAGAVHAQIGFSGIYSRKGFDPAMYEPLHAGDGATVDWVARDLSEALDFNLDNPHLADLRVREAIAHAIDRAAIIDEVLAGHGTWMRGYLPAWHPLYAGDAELPDHPFDPDRARALLQEAGYDLTQDPVAHPTRGPLALRLASMDTAPYPRPPIADLIRRQLAAVGIAVEVQFYALPEFEAEDCSGVRNGRQFDLALAGWIGAHRYIVRWAERHTPSQSIPGPANGCPLEKANWSGWRNTRVDEIVPQLKDGRLALERPDAYRRLWAEHQRLWTRELPSLPLFTWERPVVVSTRLGGVRPSPFSFVGVEDTWNVFEWSMP